MSEAEKDVWADHMALIAGHEQSRVLGMIFALSSEVFALKAEVKRLRIALADSDVLGREAEMAAGEGAAFAAWLAREQLEHSSALFKPWMEADEAPDVSGIALAESRHD